jgi:YesN/AraC family two-component response regulator
MDEVAEKVKTLEVYDADIKNEMLRMKIEEYIDEKIIDASLEGLAEHLGYSPVYTGSLVRKITGETYKKYLQKKRLEMSEKLLTQTDLSIEEIVKKVGYENASFFRKKFKERYGSTPLNYRKRKAI